MDSATLPLLLLLFVGVTRGYVSNLGCIPLNQGLACGSPSRSVTGREYLSFLGLRYAEPPVGRLRFKDPVWYDQSWNKHAFLNTSFLPPVCPQWDPLRQMLIGDEDCLFLNIFAPQHYTDLPVMVFVHGGSGFTSGGIADFGPRPLMDRNKVLITVQYRLGVLGYMSTSSKVAPGNYGLMDLMMALRWVQENIIFFGGDRNKVTLFGQGSGAAAVSLLIVSPLAKGLFSAAIVQSGSAFCDWAIQEKPRRLSVAIASQLKCQVDSNDLQLVDCLREKSWQNLVEAQRRLTNYGYFPVLSAPIIDEGLRSDPVLPMSPRKMYESEQHNAVPLVAGQTLDEGLTLFEAMQLEVDLTQLGNNALRDHVLPDILSNIIDKRYDINNLWNSTRQAYFRDVRYSIPKQLIPPFIELLGDAASSICIDELLRLHSESSPTYAYVYAFRNYPSSQRYMLNRLIESLDTASDYELRMYFSGAVSQGDELLHLFDVGNVGFFPPITEITSFTSTLLALWSSFAIHRNFASSERQRDTTAVKWQPFDLEHQQYLYLSGAPHMRSKYKHRELAMWRQLLHQAQHFEEVNRQIANASEPYLTIMWVLVAVCAILVLAVFLLLIAGSNSSSYKPNL